MIGLDTNILVRIMTNDDPPQVQAAHQLIQQHCSAEQPGFINHIVLCELLWVLERGYDYPRVQIAAAVERLLRTKGLVMENRDAVWNALRYYRQQGGDFADCLIGEKNRQARCDTTYTFDQRAAKMPKFTLVTI